MKPLEFIHHDTPIPGTHYACGDGFDFAMPLETMAEAWDCCPRPDWLFWTLDRLNLPYERERRLFSVWCARSVAHLLTDRRSKNAIDVAEKFANGRATAGELADAYASASAAYDFASSASAYDFAAAAASASVSAASAAYDFAAASAAAASSFTAASASAQSAQADHLRTLIPNPFKETP